MDRLTAEELTKILESKGDQWLILTKTEVKTIWINKQTGKSIPVHKGAVYEGKVLKMIKEILL